MTDSVEWPLNRPVSAHLTIHYRDGPNADRDGAQDGSDGEAERKVVRTVLNIDTEPMHGDAVSPLATPHSSRRSSGGSGCSPSPSHARSVSQSQATANQYGPCGFRPDFGNNHYVARRFSAPDMPPQFASSISATPFVRSSSYKDALATRADASDAAEAAEADHDTHDPNQRYHPRRNSIAVKFRKASYRKA
ncbi:hypothetical protein HG535_0A07090 [Zygotorulaspora mrakii]|uniref:Uncharacterized protein n=1 Tax=Zygotorulaspora mrakii TaxID=42260 RepID=A0A7H9AXA7_ZYGMR|nr:uncharacterized protein HG535_0A07090 [Zygotorulaspora mrakii]QLG70767.1 hypothetical protein HG535_0A07090 [Zygotorulaspora mrakii]